ncbi:MAG: cupin domain-containing protein [Thermomicrobiales bacterium]|nr:cupin domain-containing protein [Thermomicrobiales bacterium]
MGGITVIDFTHPDETRTVPHGRIDLVHVGDSTIAQMIFEPGWHWTVDMKPIVGTDRCPVRHVGYLVSGRLKVTAADGAEKELGPGMAYVIEPGHDAIVVGSEPAISLEYSATAAESLASKAG